MPFKTAKAVLLQVTNYLTVGRGAEHLSLYPSFKARHSGMDCRNLGYMDVYRLPSMAVDTGFPAGITVYLSVCITMSAEYGSDYLCL